MKDFLKKKKLSACANRGMSHTAEAFAQGTWRMEMEDGPSVMVRDPGSGWKLRVEAAPL